MIFIGNNRKKNKTMNLGIFDLKLNAVRNDKYVTEKWYLYVGEKGNKWYSENNVPKSCYFKHPDHNILITRNSFHSDEYIERRLNERFHFPVINKKKE